MTTPGYSATPLPKKLGLKDGQRVLFLDLPGELDHLRQAAAFGECIAGGWERLMPGGGWDAIHAFTTSRAVLEGNAQRLKEAVARDGFIWISWPKKASKVPTDITEDVIRELLLPTGLVDIKVAAVSDIWSGLKLMIRRELR